MDASRKLVCTEEDWSAIAPNHALWVAQYANNDRTGYQNSPWLPSGGFGAWTSCSIHQYTSNGRPDGYDGPLDLDIAYMTRAAWDKFCNPSGAVKPEIDTPATQPQAVEGTALELAARVMRGEFGAGDERKAKLGTRYDEMQDLINYVDQTSCEQLADDVERGMFGVNPIRAEVLGGKAKSVQAIVNKRAGICAASVYIVKSGDTLSGIGAKVGVEWQAITSKNSIASPYTIYPGQKLFY